MSTDRERLDANLARRAADAIIEGSFADWPEYLKARYDRPTSTASQLSAIRNSAAYMADVPLVVPWLAEPLVYFGGVTLLAGLWKSGKSTLVAHLLRARERDELFLEKRVPQGPALLVTEEGGVPTRHKVGTLTKLDILDHRAALERGMGFDGVLATIADWCAHQADPALVVIDTFAVWAGVEDENDAGQVTATMKAVGDLAVTTGSSVTLVDHLRKEGGDYGRAIRGSGAKAASADILAEFGYAAKRFPKTDRVLRLAGRVIEPVDIHLAWDTLTRAYTVLEGVDDEEADAAATPSPKADEWLAVFRVDGPGLTVADLAKVWNVQERAVFRRVAELGDRIRAGGGSPKRYWLANAPVEAEEE